MKILVDADACPVKKEIEAIARENNLELIMVSNVHHMVASDYATILVVDGAAQSADITIINMICPEDIVVTQDYGLASIAIAKGSYAIDPRGKLYNVDNIDSLLLQRYINQKARQAGHRINGPRKRKPADNSLFEKSLRKLVEQRLTD